MAAGEQLRNRRRISFALLAGVTLGACAAAETPGRAAEATADVARTDGEAACAVERVPLGLPNGIEVYVEPQNLLKVGGELLVAGFPTYTWEVGSAARAIRLTNDALAAVYIGADPPGIVAKPPMDVSFGSVRAVPLDHGRWGAVFSEEDPDSLSKNKEYVVRLWYGEYDGARWTPLERMPRPPEGALFVNASSRLVRSGERLAWAVVHVAPPEPSTVLLYQREQGRWSVEPMPGDGADNAQIAYDDAQGLLLAVFGEDPDLAGWQKSLRLYRRGRGWDFVQRVAVPAPGAEVTISIAADASGVSVGWIESGAGSSTARAVIGIGGGRPGRATVLDESAEQLVALSGLAGRSRWVVDHSSAPSGTRELRLLRVDSLGQPEQLASVPNPYTGYFATLATGANEVAVVGPQFDADPSHPIVRSLILRLNTSCD